MSRFALGSLDGRQLNRPRDHQAPLGGFAFQPQEVLELLLIRLALLPTETVDHRPSIPFPSTRGHGQENLILNLRAVDFAIDRPGLHLIGSAQARGAPIAHLKVGERSVYLHTTPSGPGCNRSRRTVPVAENALRATCRATIDLRSSVDEYGTRSPLNRLELLVRLATPCHAESIGRHLSIWIVIRM